MNSKKIKIILFLFINLLLFSQKKDLEYKLVIVHTNDTHGHPLKFSDNQLPDQGGIPARFTLINQIRSENENVIVLDAGDINTGRAESNFFKGEPDILGYNEIGYDAAVLGNHEFDNGLQNLYKQMKLAKFPFICANIKTKDKKYLTTPYIIKQYKGFKVGVFGLTTLETLSATFPDNVKDLIFEDEVETAKKIVKELKLKVDIIIALVHMGIYNNDEIGSRRIAKYVPDINLIVDGHSHTKLKEPVIVNNIPIVQAYYWGLYLGKGVATIKNKKIVDFKWELIPINVKEKVKKEDGSTEIKYIANEIKEDQRILDLLTPYLTKVDDILKEVIGTSEGLFSNKETRLQETPIGDLVCDSMLWYTKNLNVDFAINNGGGIRADLQQGDITKKNIYEILPFDNTVIVLTLKGTDVIALFDYLPSTIQTKGNFPQVSEGVSFILNYETSKSENVLINGAPIDPHKLYKVATNSYLAAGGDNYTMFKNCVEKYDTSMFQRDVLIEYIKSLGKPLVPAVKNRFKVIGSKTGFLFIQKSNKTS